MEHCHLSKSTSSTTSPLETSLSQSHENSEKGQTSSSKQKGFIVVWFDDAALALSDNAQKAKTDLKHIMGTLTIFDDANKCVEFINDIQDLQILLIVSESNGAQVVRRVLHVSELKSVYILCSNQSEHPSWATDCKPVKCMFVDSISICERIEIDTEDDSIGWDAIGASSISSVTLGNHDKQDAKFMYSQLLKYTLTEMSYSNDHIDNLITFFQDKCNNRLKDIENVKKFQDNYANEKQTPVWCYTNYAFLYKTLNEALRTCDIDVLCTLSVFIKDLHQQIVKLYNQQIIDRHKIIKEPKILKLYRGQVILTSEFRKVKKGGLLSFNNFLSTSLVKDVANIFADGASHDSSSVLFEIIIDQSMSTNAFYADIQAMSQHTDEAEYLFTMGSVFRIESIEKLDGNAKWCVHLTLTTDHDPELAQLTNYIQKEMEQPNLVSLCSLMVHMGELEKAIEISATAIKVSNEVSDLCVLLQLSGTCHLGMGNYQKGFAELELASDYAHQLPNSKELNLSIDMTKSVFLLQQGKLDLATTNIQSILKKELEYSIAKPNQERIAGCNLLMGIIYQRQGRFLDALSYQRKAYNLSKEYLPSIHPVIGECLDQLAITYMNMGQTDEAFFCMEESVKIKQDSLLPEHVSAVSSQETHEALRSLKGDHSISQSYTQCLSTTLLKWQSDSKQNSIKLLLQGRMCMRRNQIDKALSIIDQYLSIQGENLSLPNPDLANAYMFKGMCHTRKEDLPEALQNLRQAYDIAAQNFGETHPMRVYILLLIADVHAKQDNADEVLIILDRCKDSLPNEFNNFTKVYGENPVKSIVLTFRIRGFNHRLYQECEKALSIFQECLKIQMNFLPNDHLALADTYSSIASALHKMHNYSEAIINYQNARYIFEKHLPHNDPNIAKILKKMGSVYIDLQQYDDALFAYSKYLQIQLNTFPLDYSVLADTYDLISNIFSKKHNVSDAIVNCRCALDIRVKYLSSTDLKITMTWTMMGLFSNSVKQYDDALLAFNKVLEIQSITLPSKHIDIAVTHKRIASAYILVKQYERAVSSLRKCLDIQMNLLSPDHMDLADTHSSMGTVFYELKNFSDALINYQCALDIQLKHLPATSLDIIANFEKLGKVYFMLHQYDDSISAYDQCLEIQLNVLPPNHIDIAVTHKRIALIYYGIEQFQEALSSFQTCLNIQMSSLSLDHFDLADTHACTGNVSLKLNNFSDALFHCQRALDTQLKHLPATSLQAIKSLKMLGFVYSKLRLLEDSLFAYDQCLEIQLKVFSSNHIDIAATHKVMGLLYSVTKQYEEALSSFRKCLDIQMRSLPSDHPDRADTQSQIDKVSCKLNNFSDALFNKK